MKTKLDEKDISILTLIQENSKLTARQIAFEAALKASASIFQMTLLDYL